MVVEGTNLPWKCKNICQAAGTRRFHRRVPYLGHGSVCSQNFWSKPLVNKNEYADSVAPILTDSDLDWMHAIPGQQRSRLDCRLSCVMTFVDESKTALT